MKDLVLKEFDDCKFRAQVDENGMVWFVAQDVCSYLGLKYVGSAVRRLHGSQRGSLELYTLGGNQEVSAVNEFGLYALILKSKKSKNAKADRFQLWITNDLLPTLRRTGRYEMTGSQLVVQDEFANDPAIVQHKINGEMIRNWLVAQKQIRQNEIELLRHEMQLQKVESKVEVHEATIEGQTKLLEQMNHRRRGLEPVPEGTMTIQQIRAKIFRGHAVAVISEFLTNWKHPRVPYTYVVNGVEHMSHCYFESGLAELYRKFVDDCEFVRETEQRVMARHPFVSKPFAFIKGQAPESSIAKVMRSMRQIEMVEADH